ncbi:MAG: hypothetical protein ACRDRL_21670 [Sciscionella sp.]
MIGAGYGFAGATPWCVRSRSPTERMTHTVDWNALRARCQQRVTDLLQHTGVPAPWDINDFVDRLERHRGRAIDLCALWGTAGGSSGAWRQHADHDVIAYAAATSGFHQDHIILHEIGHMISAHRGRCVLSEQDAQRLAPDLAPAAFAHLLDRSSTEAEEHEAEMIASLIHQQVRGRRQISPGVAPPAVAQRLTRVEDVFGG